MFKSGKPCSFCRKDTKYVAMVDGEMLYFCKLGRCKGRYLDRMKHDQITEAFIKQNNTEKTEFKLGGFILEKLEKLTTAYSLTLRSESGTRYKTLNGTVLLFINKDDVDFFNINDEYEVTITKKAKQKGIV